MLYFSSSIDPQRELWVTSASSSIDLVLSFNVLLIDFLFPDPVKFWG